MDLQSILTYAVGAALALAALSIILYLLKRRGFEGRLRVQGGSVDLSLIARLKPDAICLVLDVENKSIYYTALRWQGSYYTYNIAGRVGKFIPLRGLIFNCGSFPCFVGVRYRDTIVEYDFDLSAKMGVASGLNTEYRKVFGKPLMTGMRDLVRLITSQLAVEGARSSGSIAIGSLTIEDPLFELTEDLYRFFASAMDIASDTVKDLGTISLETGGAIERRLTVSGEWGRLAMYIAIAIGIVVMLLTISQMIAVR